MNGFFVGAILMFVGILIARFINEKNMKKLSPEERDKLITLFSNQRRWSLGLLIILLVGYYIIIQTGILPVALAFTVYLTIVIALMAFLAFQSQKTMRLSQLPEFYIQGYLNGTAIRATGILFFVVGTIFDPYF